MQIHGLLLIYWPQRDGRPSWLTHKHWTDLKSVKLYLLYLYSAAVKYEQMLCSVETGWDICYVHSYHYRCDIVMFFCTFFIYNITWVSINFCFSRFGRNCSYATERGEFAFAAYNTAATASCTRTAPNVSFHSETGAFQPPVVVSRH